MKHIIKVKKPKNEVLKSIISPFNHTFHQAKTKHFHIQFFMHVVNIYGFKWNSTFPHLIFCMDCQNLMVSGGFPRFHIQFFVHVVKIHGFKSNSMFPHFIFYELSKFHGVRWISTFPHPIFCACRSQNSWVQVEFHVSTFNFFSGFSKSDGVRQIQS